jgi:hypothetical protein
VCRGGLWRHIPEDSRQSTLHSNRHKNLISDGIRRLFLRFGSVLGFPTLVCEEGTTRRDFPYPTLGVTTRMSGIARLLDTHAASLW